MTDERLTEEKVDSFPRRLFLRDVTTAATVMSLSPNILLACQAASGITDFSSTNTDEMEQALDIMSGLAPLSNHGPMAAEALVALGRADSVISFAEGYKKQFRSSYPQARQMVTRKNWREALGDGSRVADWAAFFNRELKESAWPQVLDQWSTHLAPGVAAAAAHGLIRTAHAVRSLSVKETDMRLRELAEGLGYWAAYYQPLPETQPASTEKLKPAQAIDRVPSLPVEKQPRGGSIMLGLQTINDFAPFASVVNMVEITNKAEQFISELTETFATAYLKNVHQRNFIALIHAVTGTTAIRSLLPYLSPQTTQRMLRYGWQMAAALYSVFGSGSTNQLPETREIRRDNLIDRATTSQEVHAIKFTEACLREYALNPKQIYLQAAQHALTWLA